MSAVPKEYVKKKILARKKKPAAPAVMQLDSPEEWLYSDSPSGYAEPQATDAELEQLMSRATTPEAASFSAEMGLDNVGAPREPFYGHVPDRPSDRASIYETAAGLGVGRNMMAMGGFNGGTDPESYVRTRLAELKAYDDAVQAQGETREQRDPNSALSRQMQDYNAALGAPIDGVSAEAARAMGAAGHAQNLQIKNMDVASQQQLKQMDIEGRLQAAKLKKGGGGSGGGAAKAPLKLTADGQIDWSDPRAADALNQAGGNKFIAERALRDPKFAEKVGLKHLTEGKRDDDQTRKRVEEYGKAKDAMIRLEAGVKEASAILSRNPTDAPNVGLWDRFIKQPAGKVLSTVGMEPQSFAEGERLERARNMIAMAITQLISGLSTTEQEAIRIRFLNALENAATEGEVRRAVANAAEFLEEFRANLVGRYGHGTAAQYEANRVSQEGKVVIRDKRDGSIDYYTREDAELAAQEPDFQKNYELYEGY